MGTFENPVWTVTEVGSIILLAITLGVLFLKIAITSTKEAIQDIIYFAKKIKNYLNSK